MSSQEHPQWTRHEFTVQSALAMLSGVAITVTGCGGSSSNTTTGPTATPAPAPTTPTVSDINGVVGTNHGHTAPITAAQLTAGGAIMLDIQGSSNHPHTVSLSANEVSQIAAGTRVTKTSTNNAGHTHEVTFN